MNKDKHLHIISFDIPYPPSYGGVIDVYYKIKAFSDAGIKIHLHCFEYGRKHSAELEQICESVTYYQRKTSWIYFFQKLPYIVASRDSHTLIKHLEMDSYPILMEGLHSCFLLKEKRFLHRRLIVRTHNIEHEYYENLFKVERHLLKKIYFYIESKKLAYFEKELCRAGLVASISRHDHLYFSAFLNNVCHIPAFHPFEEIQVLEGKGKFAFYHGNLSVGENNEAALYLVNEVFNDIEIPLLIAGSNPSKELVVAIAKRKNITLKENILTEEIHRLISEAQINVLPTFQATGMKLKLLAVLFSGRHCVVNTPMVKETGVESLCHIADNSDEMKMMIKELFSKNFDAQETENRKKMLMEDFLNKKNIAVFIQQIFYYP